MPVGNVCRRFKVNMYAYEVSIGGGGRMDCSMVFPRGSVSIVTGDNHHDAALEKKKAGRQQEGEAARGTAVGSDQSGSARSVRRNAK
jgi:hypothetical protein